MSVQPAIVVVGSVNVDLTVRVDRRPAPGETVIGSSFTVSPGGKGANQAVAAARLGGAVAMVGAVGQDANRTVALSGLAGAGVDTTAVAQLADEAATTGVALITVGADGDNSIVVVPGANAAVDAAAVRSRAGLVEGAAAVVVQGEIPRDGVEAAARLARGRLVLNLAPAIEVDPEVLRLADPLVVNEHEGASALRLLTGPGQARPDRAAGPAPGRAPADEDPAVDPADERTVVAALLRSGVPSVVLTRGERGCVLGRRDEHGVAVVSALPAIVVPAVDTTGAGDAFVGALTVALTRGDDLDAAARFATRVAAYTVQRPGAQTSYPDRGSILPGDHE